MKIDVEMHKSEKIENSQSGYGSVTNKQIPEYHSILSDTQRSIQIQWFSCSALCEIFLFNYSWNFPRFLGATPSVLGSIAD